MFMTGVLCTVYGAQVYLTIWDRMLISGTEPSSLVLSQTKVILIIKTTLLVRMQLRCTCVLFVDVAQIYPPQTW